MKKLLSVLLLTPLVAFGHGARPITCAQATFNYMQDYQIEFEQLRYVKKENTYQATTPHIYYCKNSKPEVDCPFGLGKCKIICDGETPAVKLKPEHFARDKTEKIKGMRVTAYCSSILAHVVK